MEVLLHVLSVAFTTFPVSLYWLTNKGKMPEKEKNKKINNNVFIFFVTFGQSPTGCFPVASLS